MENNDQKVCLVTGASGLLGSHLLPLLCRSFSVFAITSQARPPPVDNDVTWLCIDLSCDHWESQLPKKIDHVVHLAQSNRFRDFPQEALHVFQVNTVSTIKLVIAAKERGALSFIYASTGGVYGNNKEECFVEEQLTTNLGFYPASKLSAEVCLESFRQYLSVWIIRPFFIYGENQNRSMLLPRLVDAVANGKPITLQGENGLFINPIHVSDAAAMVAKCVGKLHGCTINMAGPETISLKEICLIIGEKLKKKPVFEVQNKVTSDPRCVGNMEATTKVLGVEARVRFRDGVDSIL